jgi:hypothetical protein
MKYSATLIGIAAAVATGGLLSSAAAGADEPRAVLHFADHSGIKDWRPTKADGADALLIEGRNGDWFRATFWAPCPEIRFAPAVAFVPDSLGNLDETTSIMVEGKSCNFRTFERTGDPDEQGPPEGGTRVED